MDEHNESPLSRSDGQPSPIYCTLRQREREPVSRSRPFKLSTGEELSSHPVFFFHFKSSPEKEKMGEEEKKPEEKKEEKKEEPKAEKPSEDKKEEKKAEESKDKEAPPPPQEIVLRVYMHCEGCARKVRRYLKGFEGVEDVQTDCKTDKVVVKGEKADPLKVLDRVQKKSHRKVELLSPIPKPPPTPAVAEEAKKPEEKEAPKPEEKKEEPITVILNVHMHCEACAQEIKRRILRMDGVENVEPDLKSLQVTVKGVFDPQKLVEYVHKRTGKHSSIVKQEPDKKEEEKKADGGGDKDAEKKGEEPAKEKKDGGGEEAAPAAVVEGEGETATLVDLRKSEFYYSNPLNYQIHPYEQRFETYPPQIYETYPPQIFSDENPNACSVM